MHRAIFHRGGMAVRQLKMTRRSSGSDKGMGCKENKASRDELIGTERLNFKRIQIELIRPGRVSSDLPDEAVGLDIDPNYRHCNDNPEICIESLSDEDEYLLEHWDQGLDCDITSCSTQTKSQVGKIPNFSDLFGEVSDDDEDDDVDDDGQVITDNDDITESEDSTNSDDSSDSDSDDEEKDMDETSSDSDSDSSDSDSSDSETDSDDDFSDSDSDDETSVRERRFRPIDRNRRTTMRKRKIRPIARKGRTARSMRKLLLKRLTLLQARDTNMICCKNACYGAWRWVRRCDVDWDFS